MLPEGRRASGGTESCPSWTLFGADGEYPKMANCVNPEVPLVRSAT
jgi:hypothetical protein